MIKISTNVGHIEISTDAGRAAVTALRHLALEHEKLAEEAQKAAEARYSDNLVYDYAPVAKSFRDSAESFREHKAEIESRLNEEEELDD